MVKSNSLSKVFNQYYLVAQIGKGTASRVYLAQPASALGRNVVIKALTSIRFSSVQERESFLQEVKFLKQVQHPHILPILDVGVEKGIPYIVTDYASNGSLRDRLKHLFSRRLSTEESVRILSQVGQALQYAHERNILHCNIKPENILFDANENVLLADFSLASLTPEESTESRSRKVMTYYTAPEQIRGEVSKESDQYALGCVAYELFSERVPFTTSVLSRMRLKRHAEVALPTYFPVDLPKHIEQAILRALATDPTKRYADVAAFIKALNTADVSESAEEISWSAPTVATLSLPSKARKEPPDLPDLDGPVRKPFLQKRPTTSKLWLTLAICSVIILATFFLRLSSGSKQSASNAALVPLASPGATKTLVVPQLTPLATSTAQPSTQFPPQGQPTPIVTPALPPSSAGNLQHATVAASPPVLLGNLVDTPNAVNLTTEGTADWMHWGLATPDDINHKSGVSENISFTVLGSVAPMQYSNALVAYSWSDGTPTGSAVNSTTGIYVNGLNNGFSLAVPANTTRRVVKLYVGVFQAQAQVVARLSDGSAPPYTSTSLANTSSTTNGIYTFDYQAASAGQSLSITFTLLTAYSSFGNVTWQAMSMP